MSVLEIVLYITLGVATTTYVVITIVKTIRRRKGKGKKDNED